VSLTLSVLAVFLDLRRLTGISFVFFESIPRLAVDRYAFIASSKPQNRLVTIIKRSKS
jgi:hypothetical protein